MKFSPAQAISKPLNLMIALYGESGGGKSLSALRLAKGLCSDPSKIFFIDTEQGRGLYYQKEFNFQYGAMDAPYSPEACGEALEAAKAAGAEVIIFDSFSDVWEGPGGCIDMAEELVRSRGDFGCWQKPKADLNRLLSYTMPTLGAAVIVTMRAKEKTRMQKIFDPKKNAEINTPVPVGLQPIHGDRTLYSMTVSMLLDPAEPGVPRYQKLMDEHIAILPKSGPITERHGRSLALWLRPESLDQQGLENRAIKAAKLGREAIQELWASLTEQERAAVNKIETDLQEILKREK